MAELKIPSLYYPFPSGLNPHTEEVHRSSVEKWARWMGYGPSSTAYQKLKAARFCELIGRGWPNASAESLALLTDFVTFLFLWDDVGDDTGLGKEPEKLRAMNERAVEILVGGAPVEQDGPLLAVLADIYRRLKERMPGSWMRQFAHDVEDYFAATVWEANNRASGAAPSLKSYLQMRQMTGGCYPLFDLSEVADGTLLPIEVRTHPVVAEMMRAATNVLCWSNDILSIRKELDNGDVHNVVSLIHREQQCSLQEAFYRAAALHDAEVCRFLELEQTLPRFSEPLNRQVNAFLDSLRSFMRGNIDWSITTGRYQSIIQVPAPSSQVLAMPSPRSVPGAAEDLARAA